jgi:hypothetical protein
LRSQPRRRTIRGVVLALLIALALGLFFALPWIGAVAWVSSRVGWKRVLWSENGKEFPTQAASLRSFQSHR